MPVEQTPSERRNGNRVNDSNKIDENIIGKYITGYLPENVALVFNEMIEGSDNDDAKTPPEWLLDNLSRIIAKRVEPPIRPSISFDTTEKSLNQNSELLHSFDFDMGIFLNYHQTTTLNYRSEFRPLGDLETILGGHPNFLFFRTLHGNGMDYKFRRELSEKLNESKSFKRT